MSKNTKRFASHAAFLFISFFLLLGYIQNPNAQEKNYQLPLEGPQENSLREAAPEKNTRSNIVTKPPLSGVWYDNSMRAYRFFGDGRLERTWAWNSEKEEARYRIKGNQLAITFGNSFEAYGNSSELLKGIIQDNVMQLVGSGIGVNPSVRLNKAPQCKGQEVACENTVFCIENVSKKVIGHWANPSSIQFSVESDPVRGLIDTTSPREKQRAIPRELGNQVSLLTCAAHLGYGEILGPNISFPFRMKVDYRDRYLTTEYDTKHFDFNIVFDQMDMNSKEQVPPFFADYPIMANNEAKVFVRAGASNLESIWHFEKHQELWKLISIERKYLERDELPLFALSNCNDQALSELAHRGNSANSNEKFDVFIIQFYCSVKVRRDNWFLTRVQIPLDYVVSDTEGEQSGQFSKSEDIGPEITTTGAEAPLIWDSNGDAGSAYLGSLGTGLSNTWMFNKIQGKWILVKVNLGRY